MTTKKEKKQPKNYSTLVLILGVVLIVAAFTLFILNTLQNKGQFADPALLINGEEVSLDELRTIYATYVPARPVAREVILDAVITDVVNYRLILQDARTKGYQATPEEIDTAFASFLAQQQLTQEEFAARLEGTGTTLDDYKTRLSEDILVNKVLQELTIEVSESDVAFYYESNIAQYLVPREVITRQLTAPSSISAEELNALANTVFTELQTRDFCAVVADYSLDKSCNNYAITQNDAFPAYVQAAFTQNVGDVSLVQGPDGYYFVLTVEKRDYNPIPLDQVGQAIGQQLRQEEFQEEYAAYIARLRENAIIINNVQ